MGMGLTSPLEWRCLFLLSAALQAICAQFVAATFVVVQLFRFCCRLKAEGKEQNLAIFGAKIIIQLRRQRRGEGEIFGEKAKESAKSAEENKGTGRTTTFSSALSVATRFLPSWVLCSTYPPHLLLSLLPTLSLSFSVQPSPSSSILSNFSASFPSDFTIFFVGSSPLPFCSSSLITPPPPVSFSFLASGKKFRL